MGNQPPPKNAPRKSMEDHIIDMKINSKQIQRAAKNAEKQQKKYMKQAKDALKKNNDDFAKLYVTSASQKRNEALNYHRTAVKMELMCDQIKSMKNNEKMMETFGNLSNAVSTQMNQFDTTKMAENLQMFNDKMDQALINEKMMTEIMNQNQVVDTNVDHMMDILKNQIALQETNKMEIKMQEDTIKVPNQQQKQEYKPQPNYQQHQIGNQANQGNENNQIDDPFLDQLKGL